MVVSCSWLVAHLPAHSDRTPSRVSVEIRGVLKLFVLINYLVAWKTLRHSPTTVICAVADAVEKEGESAVTSHEKIPESPKLTFLITTCVAFDATVWKCIKRKINFKIQFFIEKYESGIQVCIVLLMSMIMHSFWKKALKGALLFSYFMNCGFAFFAQWTVNILKAYFPLQAMSSRRSNIYFHH